MTIGVGVQGVISEHGSHK